MASPSTLSTRFTRAFNLTTPIVSAPMAGASGGALASAVAKAGGLGLIGGGYGDAKFTLRECKLADELTSKQDQSRLGCGFITWKLSSDKSSFSTLEQVLSLWPSRPIFLSFGDPRPYSQLIKSNNSKLICQIQNISQLPNCIEAGADVIVAQGSEAGGHGGGENTGRSTFTFLPECALYLKQYSPETTLLCAGGVATGSGLAASLCLGSDGALVGSRFWASHESLAEREAIDVAFKSNGDGTVKSGVFDILRGKNWPVGEYAFRALKNELHTKWEGNVDKLRLSPDEGREEYNAGVKSGDYSKCHVTVGEAVGLINEMKSADEIVGEITKEAVEIFGGLNPTSSSSFIC